MEMYHGGRHTSEENESLTDVMTDGTSKGAFHTDEAIDSRYFASRKLWSFRFQVQSTLLNTHNHFDEEELLAVSDRLHTLEKSDDFGPELIRSTKILHVLKSILRLAHIPQKELQLKERSFCLLEKWTRQHDRSLNMRTGQKLRLEDHDAPHTQKFSNWPTSKVCPRRSKRIARKNPRRSIRIAKRES